MLLLIIRKEIVHNVLSFRFVVTYALLFSLILLAMFLMEGDYETRYQDYATEVNKQRDALAELEKIEDPNKQYEDYQRTTFYGARQPRDTGILARGIEGSLPTRIASNTFFFFSSSEERLSRNMLFDIFQTPDFAYVINVVMSLLALLFVFDAVCGEKEQGTLKLLLANSVPRYLVIVGKWIGGFLSIAAPFTVAVLGGFTYLYIAGSLHSGDDGIWRFWLIYLVALLYISTFFTLGLLVSVLAQRTATALLVSLMVWIAWILLVPNVAPVVAGLLAPAPGRQIIESEKRVIDQEFQLLMEASRQRRNSTQADYEKLQKETEERKSKLDKFYQDKTNAQISLGENLARLSPSACSLFAMTRLAGTGPALFEQFHNSLTRYQEQHQEYRNDFWRSGKVQYQQETGRMEVTDEDWFQADDLPRFRMFEEGLTESVDAALFDVLLLLIYNAVFFMLSYMFFLRYDAT
ncbi:MAG TPA: DUF3526 domain-containing protein [Candidatus Handelsmanbacteria bacterium]|nr:DUF3526 domain-containing protein [Candidatus Handelsmanbacteria bacterium]